MPLPERISSFTTTLVLDKVSHSFGASPGGKGSNEGDHVAGVVGMAVGGFEPNGDPALNAAAGYLDVRRPKPKTRKSKGATGKDTATTSDEPEAYP